MGRIGLYAVIPGSKNLLEGKEVVSQVGVVTAGREEAARIGARIFGSGGNAMDAIAAAGIAGCMLNPAAAGIGGYVGAAVVLDSTDRVWSVDANSTAPAGLKKILSAPFPTAQKASPMALAFAETLTN